jgi:hypothetical protein
MEGRVFTQCPARSSRSCVAGTFMAISCSKNISHEPTGKFLGAPMQSDGTQGRCKASPKPQSCLVQHLNPITHLQHGWMGMRNTILHQVRVHPSISSSDTVLASNHSQMIPSTRARCEGRAPQKGASPIVHVLTPPLHPRRVPQRPSPSFKLHSCTAQITHRYGYLLSSR